MIGLGTIINTAAIIFGGVIGNFTGKLFNEEQQISVNKACGVSVLFIAIAGAMQGMMSITGDSLVGSILIFCVGLNLVWGKTVRVANMLPGIIFAIIAAYLPWTL